MTRQTLDPALGIDENLNWADYVDALRRQGAPKEVLVSESIRGRRLRDQYREHVTVFKLVRPRAPQGG